MTNQINSLSNYFIKSTMYEQAFRQTRYNDKCKSMTVYLLETVHIHAIRHIARLPHDPLSALCWLVGVHRLQNPLRFHTPTHLTETKQGVGLLSSNFSLNEFKTLVPKLSYKNQFCNYKHIKKMYSSILPSLHYYQAYTTTSTWKSCLSISLCPVIF